MGEGKKGADLLPLPCQGLLRRRRRVEAAQEQGRVGGEWRPGQAQGRIGGEVDTFSRAAERLKNEGDGRRGS